MFLKWLIATRQISVMILVEISQEDLPGGFISYDLIKVGVKVIVLIELAFVAQVL